MNANRLGPCFQPDSLATATSVYESRDAFVAARNHHPAAVAGQLLLDTVETLLPKRLPEDRLLIHEMANVPPGNPGNVQRLRRKAVPIHASLRRRPAYPICEF